MKVSEFQYTNPHLTEMVFMENPNFVMNKEKIEITENILSNIKKIEGNHAVISVSLVLGDLDDFEKIYNPKNLSGDKSIMDRSRRDHSADEYRSETK